MPSRSPHHLTSPSTPPSGPSLTPRPGPGGGLAEPVCPCDASPRLGLRLGLGLKQAEQKQYPDPALLRPASPVTGVHPEIPRLAAALIRAMERWGVRALAAPQLGIDGRVVVVGLDGGPACLVNPCLEPLSREITVIETCLSRPGVQAVAQRFRRIRVTGWDPARAPLAFDLDGPAALALQHSVDHLDGRVICAGLPALRVPERAESGDPGAA